MWVGTPYAGSESDLSFQSDSESRLSSFILNVEQQYHYESRRDLRATRLREFEEYRRCVILPDDPWKVKWNFLLFV